MRPCLWMIVDILLPHWIHTFAKNYRQAGFPPKFKGYVCTPKGDRKDLTAPSIIPLVGSPLVVKVGLG